MNVCASCINISVHSQDLGRLIIWVLREYEEIDPIILSGEYSAVLTFSKNDAFLGAFGIM